jgi:hypothetical protein
LALEPANRLIKKQTNNEIKSSLCRVVREWKSIRGENQRMRCNYKYSALFVAERQPRYEILTSIILPEECWRTVILSYSANLFKWKDLIEVETKSGMH